MKNITLSEDEIKKLKKIHLKYLNTSYNIRCYNIFSEEEFDILKKYGCWMEALAKQNIKPFTEEQEHFVAVANNKMQPQTNFEKIWIKYKRRLLWEKDNNSSLLVKKNFNEEYYRSSRQRGWK